MSPAAGSAPDIAGRGSQKPIARPSQWLLMLRYSFDLDREADAVEKAVGMVLKDGYGLLISCQKERNRSVPKEMGDRICAYIGEVRFDR